METTVLLNALFYDKLQCLVLIGRSDSDQIQTAVEVLLVFFLQATNPLQLIPKNDLRLSIHDLDRIVFGLIARDAQSKTTLAGVRIDVRRFV